MATSAADPERLNEDGFGAFGARAGDEAPVAMLSLLRFRSDGGRERYIECGAAPIDPAGELP